MKISDKMKIDGISVGMWQALNHVCQACPYLCDKCIEEDECEMIEQWITEGRIKLG